MASTVSENGGDAIEEVAQETDNGEPKLNGEINGSCDEPMEVDDSPVKSVKKVNSSDVNCIEESERTSNNKETNLSSENSDENMDTAVSDEVPENGEASNSNGIEEGGEDDVDGDDVNNEDNEEVSNQEESRSVNSQENENNDEEEGTEDVIEAHEEDEAEDTNDAEAEDTNEADAEDTNEVEAEGSNEDKENDQEDDDDDVVLMDEEACEDPFAAEPNHSEQNTPNNENDSGDMDGSDVEQVEEIEDKDPFDCENDKIEDTNSENKLDDSKEIETKEKSEDENRDDDKDTSGENNNDESKDDEKMEDEENKAGDTSEKKSDEDDKTPEKNKKKKDKVQQPLTITPRRSSRNVNKPKTYIDEPDIKPSPSSAKKSSSSEDPDIEEIVPQDPLAMDSPVSDKKNKKAVVVNDPKRLVEIVSGSKPSKQGKKEPTLVIIDTNSILSGKGPIPVSPSPPMAHASSMGGSSRGSFSVLPMALPAQGMYPQGMRPPPLSQLKPIMAQPATPSPPPATPKPVILPSLTDDMYVVEAPSFIVPYVYEKPPIKPLKGYVEQVEQAIKEIKALIEKEKEREKAEKAKEEEKEKSEKESGEDKEKDDGEKKEKDDKSEKDDTDKEKDEKKDQDKKKSEKDEKMDVDAESKDDSVTEIKDDDKETESKSSESKSDKEKSSEDGKTEEGEKKKSSSYFDNPLGKFFIQIGVNLVQEHVQTDLLRSQKRKKEREGKCTPEVQQAMNSLIRSLEYSKETNEPFKLDLKKCEYCSFKTESALVMAHHLETPHMRNYVYKCNFCSLEVRSPHDILYHMEAEHNVRGRLERAPAFHQCPSCPFEDNQKGKLSRHLLSCAKKYRPERNQEPPLDFEPPAKIPRVSRTRPAMSPGNAVYQAAMSGLKQGGGHPLLPKLVPAPNPAGLIRGRGRPQMINRYLGDMRNSSTLAAQQKALAQMRPGMLYRPSGSNAQPPVLLPASYQIQGSQLYQDQMALYQQMVTNHSRGLGVALTLPQNAAAVAAASAASKVSAAAVGSSTAKLLQQPSISITPLPRQAPTPQSPAQSQQANKPGRPAGSSNSKATFVICEICDGYIKDLEQLRNHMQWIHKVKIHPKMIYNRPPLNCQKCQFRFFTDQGLERHLLGSHGLVTSSMQEAANKGKDGGRCPVCGRVYQWKLLNHVARDHSMSLKPAHLSYKCTVCTATFGMYKQFENHVYSAHSVVAKRVMDKKPSASGSQASTSSSQGDMLKPLKINDEITIIPQPARSKTKPVPSNNSNRNPPKKV